MNVCLDVRFLLVRISRPQRYRFAFNLNNSFALHAAQLARDGAPVGRYELREFFACKRQRKRIPVQRVLREMQIKQKLVAERRLRQKLNLHIEMLNVACHFAQQIFEHDYAVGAAAPIDTVFRGKVNEQNLCLSRADNAQKRVCLSETAQRFSERFPAPDFFEQHGFAVNADLFGVNASFDDDSRMRNDVAGTIYFLPALERFIKSAQAGDRFVYVFGGNPFEYRRSRQKRRIKIQHFFPVCCSGNGTYY